MSSSKSAGRRVGFADEQGKSGRESRSRSRGRPKDRRAKSQDVRRSSVREGSEPRKRDRSLISLVRSGSRKSVQSLVKLFEGNSSLYYMNEGRKSQIVLPDERRLEILIQPKLYTHELLDLVGSHFKLKEKEYFGLAFLDDTGHYNWLQGEKKILEHDLPRKQGTNTSLTLFFLVRFYVECITQLQDTSTIELFYLNAKQAVFKGQIECDSETVFELAAHVLQTTCGDYADDETTKVDLKKLPVITTSALKEHPSISYCEDRVIAFYKKLAGTARGLAIVKVVECTEWDNILTVENHTYMFRVLNISYMTIVESLPTYGIHYYEVKDKKDIPWWLGISYKGIGVYDKNDRSTPRRLFVWKNLENLYYREKKFSIEVHDPKRVLHTLSSFNLYEDAIREPLNESDELSDAISDPTTQVSVSRRTFGPGSVNVHAWFGSSPQLTKCIWTMAVAQHQFYHDRKNSRVNLPTVRSVSELASELSKSTTSLTGSTGSDISRSGSSASLPSLGASRFDLNFDPADTQKVQREMYSALKARREALEDILKKKTEELKLLCIKEGELTGVLPPDTPLAPGEQPPQIRRRMGTAFSLADKLTDKNEEEDKMSKLELELELQKQILNAAAKLASDKSVSRYVRKQRRQSFNKAQGKYKDMEKKLNEIRDQSNKPQVISPPPATYDGMYRVNNPCTTGHGFSQSFSDDTYVNRHASESKGSKSSKRLSRSFREKNLIKPTGLNVTCREISRDMSLDFRDLPMDLYMNKTAIELSKTTYEIPADSLYHSSYHYIPEDSLLDMAFTTPSLAPVRRRELSKVSSPATRRSKRASWHHTMFEKLSPKVTPKVSPPKVMSPRLAHRGTIPQRETCV